MGQIVTLNGRPLESEVEPYLQVGTPPRWQTPIVLNGRMVHDVTINGYDYPPAPSDSVLYYPGLPGQRATIWNRCKPGATNDGTITGAIWRRLPSGLWYLGFDGDDFVVTPAHASLTFGTGDFSIIAYGRVTDITATQRICALSYNTGVAADHVSAGLYFESDLAIVFARSSTGTLKAGFNVAVINTWYCVGLSRLSGVLYGFLNGVPMTTTAVAGANFDYSSTGKAYWGAQDNDAGGTSNHLTGDIALEVICNAGLSAVGHAQFFSQTRHLF